MNKYYAGIGSRKTPANIRQFMFDCGARLGKMGYTLRSGGAAGADTAFAMGAEQYSQEIFRPFGEQVGHIPGWFSSYDDDTWDYAQHIASGLHPAWNRCSHYARSLHTRNVFQILGHDLKTPSEFVICWTPDGAISGAECGIQTGGTGMAIRVASQAEIPVLNLQRLDHIQQVLDKLW